MKRNMFNILVFSFVFLALTSCGDQQLANQDVVDINTLGSGEGSCSLDAKKLATIMENDVAGEINCLENKLYQFLDLVEQEDEGQIEKAKIVHFINKFFSDDAIAINNALELGYKMNRLLFRGSEDTLSAKNIRLLMEILHVINKEGAELFKFLIKIDAATYWDSRVSLQAKSFNLGQAIIAVINKRKGEAELNLINLIDDLAEMSETPIDVDPLKSNLFLKSLFFGGDEKSLKTSEIISLFDKLDDLLLINYDLLYRDSRQDFDKSLFFLDLLGRVKKNLHNGDKTNRIVSLEKLLKLVGDFIPVEEGEPKKDLLPGISSIRILKKQFIGGSEGHFSLGDVHSFLGVGLDVLEHFYFYRVIFDHYRDELYSPDEIDDLELPKLRELKRFSESRQIELLHDFNFQTQNYRFFSGERYIQAYSRDYRRNLEGYKNTFLFRLVFNGLLEIYGRNIDGVIGKVISQEDMKNALKGLKPLLDVFNAFPKDPKRFVFEAFNSSDLFQYYANGDGFIGLGEISQYINIALGASSIGADINESLVNYCEVIGEDSKGSPTYAVPCFREHFFQTFLNDLGYRGQFPELHEYYQDLSSEDRFIFSRNMESYGREIDDENLPVTRYDLLRLTAALSNLESIMIRYDGDNDHILSNRELNDAYPRFEKTILRLAKLSPDPRNRSFGKSIFLFLIKHQRQPNFVELIRFHRSSEKDKVTGSRKDISGILALLAKKSRPAPTETN